MSALQHAKENNFNQFARLIESMEDRFLNNDSDDIVDINSLQVVRTRSGRVSKPRIAPKSKPVTPAPTSSVTKSKRGRKQSTGSTRQSNGTSIPFSSNQSIQDSSGFESASNDSQQISSIEPNLVRVKSILFDRPSQLAATKNLLSILELGGPLSKKTASNLYERFKVTLGRDELPNKASVRPFFTFHEDHDIGVTLLFDTPDLTPWTLICLKFFGEENLGLYQQIYKYVLVEAASAANESAIKMVTSTPSTRPMANTARSEYLAVVAVRRSGSKQTGMNSTDGLDNSQQNNQSRPANPPNKSPSAMSSAYTSATSMPIYHPPIDSIVYENEKQLASLKKLAEILRQNDDESKQVKRKLVARATRTLGHDSMPYGQNVYPFFTFHEKGEIGVSFLFNINTLSPWTTICKLYFGDEILNICKDIYRMMNCTQMESLDKLEKLAVSYCQPSKTLRAAISQVHDERSRQSPKKSNSQPAMSTPITRSSSSRSFSPVVINNTAPPYRRPAPRSPASSLSGSIDSSINAPRRARMLCRTTSVRRVTRPRKSVLIDTGNIGSTNVDLALTPPALKKTRRSTTIMIEKGFSEPSLALAKPGRKSSLSNRVNTTHHL